MFCRSLWRAVRRLWRSRVHCRDKGDDELARNVERGRRTISLAADDDGVAAVLHHHPDHLVDDPTSTSGGEDDLALEEVFLERLLARGSGGLDVSLGHRGC